MNLAQLKQYLDLNRFNACSTKTDYENLVQNTADQKAALPKKTLGIFAKALQESASKVDFRRLKALSLCPTLTKARKVADSFLMKRALAERKWTFLQKNPEKKALLSSSNHLLCKIASCCNAAQAHSAAPLEEKGKRLWSLLKSQNALSKKQKWTAEETEKIKKCKYFSEAESLAAELGRSPISCSNKFLRLLRKGEVQKGSLKMIHAWSKEELARLKRYEIHTNAHQDKALRRRRSAYAILSTLESKTTQARGQKKVYHRWTDNQKKLLKSCKSLTEIANCHTSFVPHTLRACKSEWYKLKS